MLLCTAVCEHEDWVFPSTSCASNAKNGERASRPKLIVRWHDNVGMIDRNEKKTHRQNPNVLKQHLQHRIYRVLIWLSIRNGAIEISFCRKSSQHLSESEKSDRKKNGHTHIHLHTWERRKETRTNRFVDLCTSKFHCIQNGIIIYRNGWWKLLGPKTIGTRMVCLGDQVVVVATHRSIVCDVWRGWLKYYIETKTGIPHRWISWAFAYHYDPHIETMMRKKLHTIWFNCHKNTLILLSMWFSFECCSTSCLIISVECFLL